MMVERERCCTCGAWRPVEGPEMGRVMDGSCEDDLDIRAEYRGRWVCGLRCFMEVPRLERGGEKQKREK